MNWPAAVWLVRLFFVCVSLHCLSCLKYSSLLSLWPLLDALQKLKGNFSFHFIFILVFFFSSSFFVLNMCVLLFRLYVCADEAVYIERKARRCEGKEKRRVCYAVAPAIQPSSISGWLRLPIIPSTPARAPLKFSTKWRMMRTECRSEGRGFCRTATTPGRSQEDKVRISLSLSLVLGQSDCPEIRNSSHAIIGCCSASFVLHTCSAWKNSIVVILLLDNLTVAKLCACYKVSFLLLDTFPAHLDSNWRNGFLEIKSQVNKRRDMSIFRYPDPGQKLSGIG